MRCEGSFRSLIDIRSERFLAGRLYKKACPGNPGHEKDHGMPGWNGCDEISG